MAVLDVTRLLANWGYLGIVVVVVLGNVGLPVPEEIVLAIAGYFVWSGRLHWLPVLVVAIVSAVAGDNLGYWLGRRYGRAATERVSRRLLRPQRVVTAERWTCRYGALAVGAARFIGGVRFLAGPLAGSLGLPFRSFFMGNLCGALLFVPYAVGIGYAIGYGLESYVARLQQAFGGTGVVVLVGITLLIVVVLGWRRPSGILRLSLRRAVTVGYRRLNTPRRYPWRS